MDVDKTLGEDDQYQTIDQDIARLLRTTGQTLAVAESCTGGLLGHRITDVAGCSAYFKGGVVAYSDEVKERVLGVSRDTLNKEGAVSQVAAMQMATGVHRIFGADVGVATTGIAGPGGGSKEKPVGLTFIALVDRHGVEKCLECRWMGSRSANKDSTAAAALELLKAYLQTRSSE
jgi:PncC family amidohydrolase